MLSLFDGIITSKTRVRILIRFFLNPGQKAYLRELAKEFELSPGHLKGELDKLSEAGLLSQTKEGRQIDYSANTGHSLFPELHSMVKKAMGMDKILESILRRLGKLEQAFVIDDYAAGKDSGVIDLVLVGDINRKNLVDLTAKTERYIGRKIRTLVLTHHELQGAPHLLADRPIFQLWENTALADNLATRRRSDEAGSSGEIDE